LIQTFPLLYIAKIAIVVAGLMVACLGGLGGLLILVSLLFAGEPFPIDTTVTGVAFVVLGAGLGGALAWQGGSALRQNVSTPFSQLPFWLLLILYIPVIILGQLLITFDLLPALTFPPFHLLGAAIPPFAVLAFAGRAFKPAGFRWREIIVQFSGGVFLAPFLALTAEIILGLLVLFGLFLVVGLTPGGLIRLEEWLAHIQDPIFVQSPENLRELLFFPPVIITLVVVFVILGPIIEELVKPLGILLMSYRRPAPAQAFLWGLASGAGFALVENLFNTTLALEAWFFIMLLRTGATAMHCLATGLTALGWQRFLAERRPWKLLGAYSLSVVIHALWNALVIGISGIAIFTVGAEAGITSALGGGLMLLFLFFFLVLGLAIIISLTLLTHRLRKQLTMSN
jgi:RsiW-degrading membrane proteinase PrsW (M82 family)